MRLQRYEKETPAKVFSYEFCKTLKKNFYTEHFRVIASEYCFCLLSDCIRYCPALWSWIAFIVKIKHMKHVRGSCVWCTPGKFILTFKCVLSKSYIEFVTKFTLRLALPISTLIMKIFSRLNPFLANVLTQKRLGGSIKPPFLWCFQKCIL